MKISNWVIAIATVVIAITGILPWFLEESSKESAISTNSEDTKEILLGTWRGPLNCPHNDWTVTYKITKNDFGTLLGIQTSVGGANAVREVNIIQEDGAYFFDVIPLRGEGNNIYDYQYSLQSDGSLLGVVVQESRCKTNLVRVE